MKLQNQVAVITGAASGMGKAIAELFAKEGAKVVAADLNFEGAKATAEEIVAAGGKALAVAVDVSKEDDVSAMIDAAVANYGTLDILINNAGIMDDFSPAADVTDTRWERVFAVNSTGVMRATRKALSVFLPKKSGVIINVASIGGLQGARAGAAYTASKHAVIGFTKNTAFQYGKEGIRCNAIAPGAVETNIAASMGAINKAGMERGMPGMALNLRTGQPEEIAAVALFLASDDSSFINGAVLVADGGWTTY